MPPCTQVHYIIRSTFVIDLLATAPLWVEVRL